MFNNGIYESYDPKAARIRKRNFDAWVAHYMAKGCNERKAKECASRKHGKEFHF